MNKTIKLKNLNKMYLNIEKTNLNTLIPKLNNENFENKINIHSESIINNKCDCNINNKNIDNKKNNLKNTIIEKIIFMMEKNLIITDDKTLFNNWANILVDSLFNDYYKKSQNDFIKNLEEIIFNGIQNNLIFLEWYTLIPELIKEIKTTLTDKNNNEFFDHLWFSIINILKKINKKYIETTNIHKENCIIDFANETKTPLSLILNFLEKDIKIRGSSDNIKIVKDNFIKLKNDISNLIDTEKLENGINIYNHDQIINLSETLSIKILLYKKTHKRNNLVIYTDIEENIYIKIDPLALDRIINNLLDNIIKFSKKKINISLKTKDKKVKIKIIENSIYLEKKIFNYSYIVKNNMYEIIRELNIAKKIINEINGNLFIESNINNGTTFKFEFEKYYLTITDKVINRKLLLPQNNFNDDLISIQNEHKSDKKTILIADNNKEFLYFLIQHLINFYNVYFALNGKEALEKLSKMPKPNLIISEMIMDQMNGIEFYNELLKDQKNKTIPFIFTAGKSSEHIKLSSFKKGVIDYIEKPFHIEILLAKIQAILKNQEAIIELNTKEIENKIINFIRSDKSLEVKKNDIEIRYFKYKISQREKQVIELIIKGHQNKEISSILKISQNTLKVYIRNIYKKCGVSNKVELTNLIIS